LIGAAAWIGWARYPGELLSNSGRFEALTDREKEGQICFV